MWDGKDKKALQGLYSALGYLSACDSLIEKDAKEWTVSEARFALVSIRKAIKDIKWTIDFVKEKSDNG